MAARRMLQEEIYWMLEKECFMISRTLCSTAPPYPVSQCVRDTSVILWFMSLQPFKFMLNHGPSARITVVDFVSYSSCGSFQVRACSSLTNKAQCQTPFSQSKYLGVPTHPSPALELIVAC